MNFEELRRDEWLGGQLLAFSGLDGPTDYRNALAARTAFNVPGIDITLSGVCRVRFPRVCGADNVVAGDWFRYSNGETGVSGAFLDTHHLLLEGPCEVFDTAPELRCVKDGSRTLIGAASHFDAGNVAADLQAAIHDRMQWLLSLDLPRSASPSARRTLLKSLSVMKTQVYTPEGGIHHRWTTPDRWPHQRMWLWDSVFHAIGWRHIDPALARDAISAVLDMQAPDGFVAHMMDPFGTSRITQPPVLALGVKLVHETAPDDAWIGRLYPKLCAYVEWDRTHRDRDGGGLVEWEIEGDPHCRSGESGMDNSPRFDRATRMDAVDFNAFLALECEILAGFATSLGLPHDATTWRDRHARLCGLITERLWSEPLQFFVDYDVERQEPSPILASAGFLPLICGAATAAQAARLADHLCDPGMFGTAFPVPSIAAKHAKHYAKDMWRGPTWVNINWLIAYGLDLYQFHDVARALRQTTQQQIEAACEQFGTVFEFYDDRGEFAPPELARKGLRAPESCPTPPVIHDYGWTASLYVDSAYSAAVL